MKQFCIEYPTTNGRAFLQITNNQFRVGKFWIYKLLLDIKWTGLIDITRRPGWLSFRVGKRTLNFNW